MIVTNHHQLSPIVTNYHQSSPIIDFLINQLSHQLTFSSINFLIKQLSHQLTSFIFSSPYRDLKDFSSCFMIKLIMDLFLQLNIFVLHVYTKNCIRKIFSLVIKKRSFFSFQYQTLSDKTENFELNLFRYRQSQLMLISMFYDIVQLAQAGQSLDQATTGTAFKIDEKEKNAGKIFQILRLYLSPSHHVSIKFIQFSIHHMWPFTQ